MNADIRNDGYANIFTGLGTIRDVSTTTDFTREKRLNQFQLESIFEGDGVARRIVEGVAEDLCREWFTIDGDNGEEVLDILESLRAQQVFIEASTWSRLYGGAAVLFVVDDGTEGFEQPLVPEQLTKVLGIKAYDMYSVRREPTYPLSEDPVKRLQGLPSMYLVSPIGVGDEVMPFLAHESRIVRIPGKRLPERLRVSQLDGWDSSVLQGAYTSLVRYGASLGYSANILRDFVQAVLGVKNLSQILAAGNEHQVRTRLQLLDLSRSLLNVMVIDSDGETYDKKSNSIAGMPDMLDRFVEHLSGCTGIPVAKLTGRQPGGLQSTGIHDMAAYRDMLAGEQSRTLSPLAERLVELVYASSEGPAEPEAWSVRWNSFHRPTDLEIAQLRKTQADMDKVYLDTGVLSPDEVAESRFGQGAWSMETQIDASTARSTEASITTEETQALMAEQPDGDPVREASAARLGADIPIKELQ